MNKKYTFNINVKKNKEEYTENEIDIINNIFGMFVKNIYFSFNCKVIVENEKIINFSGISGSGKTIIKNEIKYALEQENDENYNILDFDDLENFEKYYDNTILELFDITNKNDEILKLISGFGLFEMRLLTMKIKNLSNGQKTRLKYILLMKQINESKKNFIFIDEFLTFVDDLSAISFARSMEVFLKTKKNVKMFCFGVNMNLIGQFEDVTYVLGNSSITAIVEKNVVKYLVDQEQTEICFYRNMEEKEVILDEDEW